MPGAQSSRRTRQIYFQLAVSPYPYINEECLESRGISGLVSIYVSKNNLDVIHTHSSVDSWLGGVARKIVRSSSYSHSSRFLTGE